MSDLKCQICNNNFLLLLHDHASDQHEWSNKPESECCCNPQSICVICCFAHIKSHAVLLGVPHGVSLDGVLAPGSQLVH